MDHGADNYLRYLGGDEEGFVEIVREYNDGLTLYLNSFVNDLALADELAEDAFVKLGLKRPRYNGKASFKTWLYAIGRNAAIDELRRKSRRREISLEECPPPASGEEDLEQRYLRSQEKILLRRSLARLKPDYRQILWLVYFEEFSMKEAAAILGKTLHGCETLAYRARRALKAELDKEGLIDEDL